jgi:hypothetical protein
MWRQIVEAAGITVDQLERKDEWRPPRKHTSIPPGKERHASLRKRLTIDGTTRTLQEWLTHFKTERRTYHKRLERGLPPEEALKLRTPAQQRDEEADRRLAKARQFRL